MLWKRLIQVAAAEGRQCGVRDRDADGDNHKDRGRTPQSGKHPPYLACPIGEVTSACELAEGERPGLPM